MLKEAADIYKDADDQLTSSSVKTMNKAMLDDLNSIESSLYHNITKVSQSWLSGFPSTSPSVTVITTLSPLPIAIIP